MAQGRRFDRRHLAATGILTVVLLGLWLLDRSGGEGLARDRVRLAERELARQAVRRLGAAHLDARGRPGAKVSVVVRGDGPRGCLDAVEAAAGRSSVFRVTPAGGEGAQLQVRCRVQQAPSGVAHLRLTVSVEPVPGGPPLEGSAARSTRTAVRLPRGAARSSRGAETLERRVAGFLALVPPFVAIVLALATGRILLSMGVALFLAALVLGVGSPEALGAPLAEQILRLPVETVRAAWVAAWRFVVLPTLGQFKLQIMAFAAALVGMVAVISRAGGTAGIVTVMGRMGRSRRLAQLSVWLMGLAIFFDDCANTLVVGSAARPLTDSAGVSREKLAYLVDSTAAPVAGVAIVSTWIGFEVGLFQTAAQSLGLGQTGMGLFFHALPYRFYCFLTIGFVLLTVVMGRELGPMLTAERRALAPGGRRSSPSGAGSLPGDPLDPPRDEVLRASPKGLPPAWTVAAVPILTVIVAVPAGLIWLGHRTRGVAAALREGLYAPGSTAHLRDCLTQAAKEGQQGWALLAAGVLGSGVAFFLARRRRRLLEDPGDALGMKDLALTYGRGARAILGAIGVLVGAWGIQAACEALGTSTVLTAALSGAVNPTWLPALIFLTSAGIAFATGTSWGTMGIVIPAVLPVAVAVGGAARPELVYLSAAAVLDGAIFGDHCSPISDTTVMSSLATGCPHLDHVRTQLPYALIVMLVATGVGYLGSAAGAWGVVPAYGLSAVLLFAVLVVLGRPVRAG